MWKSTNLPQYIEQLIEVGKRGNLADFHDVVQRLQPLWTTSRFLYCTYGLRQVSSKRKGWDEAHLARVVSNLQVGVVEAREHRLD